MSGLLIIPDDLRPVQCLLSLTDFSAFNCNLKFKGSKLVIRNL